MPMVRIDHTRRDDPDFAGKASETVRSALETAFSVPRDDFFQVVTAHEFGSGLFGPQRFLDIEHTQELVFVQITCAAGRSKEQKIALFQAISSGLARETGMRPEDVIINLVENQRENWSFGRGEAPFA